MRPLELKAKVMEPEKEETAIREEDEFEEDDEGMQFSSDALLDSKREVLDPLLEEKPAMLQNIPALPTITGNFFSEFKVSSTTLNFPPKMKHF